MFRQAIIRPQSRRGVSPVSRPTKWSAPVQGWRTDEPIGDMDPKSASMLQNWFPEAGYIRARNGSNVWASGLGAQVNTIIPYGGLGSTVKMFGAAGSKIFDCSSSGAVGSAVVSSLTSDHWSYSQLNTVGGNYITIANGSDSVQQYNGSAWSTPSFTGVTLSTLSVVHTYAERYFFIQKGTTLFWYGVTFGVSGTLASFEVGASMKYGGVLVAMGSWTTVTVSGPIVFLCFVSSEGEVIIYQGTDPSNSSNWSLLGTCKMSPPLGGDRCCFNVGGDLAIMTMDGIIPISKAFLLDPSASDQGAITAHISPTWLDTVQSVGTTSAQWQFVTFPRRRMAIVNIPDPALGTYQYVMNTETKAWTKFVGMQATCWAVWENNLYWGDANGNVQQAETGGCDNGAAIDCIGFGAWERGDGLSVRSPRFITIDATIGAYSTLYGGVVVDYNTATPTAQMGSGVASSPAVWGTAVWGTAVWPGSQGARFITAANSITGVALAPAFRALISGVAGSPSSVELYGGSYVFETGTFP